MTVKFCASSLIEITQPDKKLGAANGVSAQEFLATEKKEAAKSCAGEYESASD